MNTCASLNVPCVICGYLQDVYSYACLVAEVVTRAPPQYCPTRVEDDGAGTGDGAGAGAGAGASAAIGGDATRTDDVVVETALAPSAVPTHVLLQHITHDGWCVIGQ